MPAQSAHATASVKYLPLFFRARELSPDAAGLPFARHRKVIICALVQVSSGEKVVSDVPTVNQF